MSVHASDHARVGILAVGSYLPPTIRGNDWWPADVVEGWMRQRAAAKAAPPPAVMTPGMTTVARAMTEQAVDPFQGAVQRRVMDDDVSITDLEVAASRDAIARGGVDPAAIDLLLVHTAVPEYLLSNPASVVHARLGLSRRCLTLETDASAYSFLAQLTLAETMIRAGRARTALLVQSSGMSRLIDPKDAVSPLFGDGATAVLVGRVDDARGIVATVHLTDGAHPRTLIASVRGGRWYDDGRSVAHSAEPLSARQVFLETIDRAKEAIDAVLGEARLTAADIDFFGVHQGTPWLRQLSQHHAGLGAARSIDTFAETGYLFAASIPLGLRMAEDRGLLRNDDRVLLFGGGTGMTYGATVLRWGAA
jgi:3-oxoacyl-[acyl-carrier-protein] synthase-3